MHVPRLNEISCIPVILATFSHMLLNIKHYVAPDVQADINIANL